MANPMSALLQASSRESLPVAKTTCRGCPLETPSQLQVELPPLLGNVDGNLQLSPAGVLIVRKDALSGRIALICCGIGFFSVEFWLIEGLEPFQVFGFLFMGSLFVLGSLVLDSFEFQFDPNTRRLLLTEEVGGFGRQRTFEFSSIRAMRRESWTIEEDDAPPRERFHLFLQIGDEEVMLSPRELSREQADELQNAVKSVLDAPIPLLISNTNN